MPISRQKSNSAEKSIEIKTEIISDVKSDIKSDVKSDVTTNLKSDVKSSVKSKKNKPKTVKTIKNNGQSDSGLIDADVVKTGQDSITNADISANDVKTAALDTIPIDGNIEASKKRFFKCIYNGNVYGRLCGKKPKQAANKAFTSILKQMKKSKEVYNGQKIYFSIIECTRGWKRNRYCYVGERKSLAAPVIVPIKIKNKEEAVTQKEIIYRHKNYVKKVKKADIEAMDARMLMQQ